MSRGIKTISTKMVRHRQPNASLSILIAEFGSSFCIQSQSNQNLLCWCKWQTSPCLIMINKSSSSYPGRWTRVTRTLGKRLVTKNIQNFYAVSDQVLSKRKRNLKSSLPLNSVKSVPEVTNLSNMYVTSIGMHRPLRGTQRPFSGK